MRMISMLLDKEMQALWKGMEEKDGICCSVFYRRFFRSNVCSYVGISGGIKKR